jgi:hypothetical protein
MLKSGFETMYSVTRLHGGIEDFDQRESFNPIINEASEHNWNNSSMLSCLLHYFGTNPSILQASRPTILGLAYYPVHIILNEWNTYTQLIRRYFKYYEYSMSDITHRFHSDDIVDLQQWR